MTDTVDIEIVDENPFHVHQPGSSFALIVSSPVTVRYTWKDWRGTPLTQPRVLAAEARHSIRSPERMEIGYFGLAFAPIDPDVHLNRTEYGFAVLPDRWAVPKEPRYGLRFGTIHTDADDPYLLGWTKTATLVHGWDFERQRLDVEGWRRRIEATWNRGLIELPLWADETWETDSTRPVSDDKLAAIGAKAKQYFQATPELLYWELGIEENLQWRRHREEWPYYWSNLARKFQTVRRVADEVNPGIRLLYQVAELDDRSIEAFLASEAASHVDILSLHPYAWPDFPSPETWMEAFLERTRKWMEQYNVSMPIWFTEIGVPHMGNPGGFFGYPDKNVATAGKTRDEAVVYMIKSHVIALHSGVEKVFWYNYRDRGSRPDYAEHHFGMRDYWGFPKPLYVAYVNLIHTLEEKRPLSARRLPGDLWVYRFGDEDTEVYVVWTFPETERNVFLSDLGIQKNRLEQVTNAVGTPLPWNGEAVQLAGSPIYLIVRP